MAMVGILKRKSEAHFLVFVTSALFVFLRMIPMIDGMVHYHNFTLTEKNFTRSCVTKRMLVVNEQFPGPTLYVRRGDTVFVNVQNDGHSRVTIHWHGVKQPRNPWSDGPEYITQCAIQPGKNFTYEVIFSVEEGTVWWHAHNEWTRNTVHGAIVVYPAEGSTTPYPTPSGEQVLILGSWYNYDVNLVVEETLKTGEETPISNKFLINGLPGNFPECAEDQAFRWVVEYNKTYLLRIVSAVMNIELFFGIAEHNLTVVGTDGHYVKPFVTSFIMISPGQTMDVLVTTNQSVSGGKYFMMANQFISSIETDGEFDLTNTTAILEYNNTIDGDDKVGTIFPVSLPSHSDMDAAYHFIGKFKGLPTDFYPMDVPMNITTRLFVTVSMNQLPYYYEGDYTTGIAASLNNISWTNKEVDILQAYYRNMTGIFTEDFPEKPPTYYNFTKASRKADSMRGTKVKILNYNEEVEVIFQGTNLLYGASDHPMHLHGHSFYRVGFGSGIFDPLNDPISYNLIDPPAGNTFIVPTNGWIVVRFKANNPGVWLWHCHFDKHFSWGMNNVIITKNGGTPNSTMRDPPPNMPSCTSDSSLLFGRSSQI